MDCDEFHSLNTLVKSSIKKGHSFSLITLNNPDLNISKRTLYNYLEKGYLDIKNIDIKNIDLPRKVRYKKRTRNVPKNSRKKDSCRTNRTYEDFLRYIRENNIDYYVEMDTVEGVKGHSVLLTLYLVSLKLLLIYKLDNQTISEVNKKILFLKQILGYELFHNIFPVVLTDNGSEFKDPDIVENNGLDVLKTRLFYCDPQRSNQKGSLENAHEYIRRFIDKEIDIDNYTEEEISLMMNHIANTRRESLSGKTPYELLIEKIGEENAKKLGLYYIAPNDVTLNPSLFDKNK